MKDMKRMMMENKKQGWEIKKLGEVCQIKTGKKDVNQGNPSGKYPFFTCAREHTFSDTFSFDTEALLIAGNGDVGNVNYFNGKFEAYQRTYVLSDFVKVLPRFLFLILDGTLKHSMSGQKLGNTMPYIKLGMLKDFKIPLPPLPEQQRIVAILDSAFAAISQAKENAQKNLKNAQELFESYLQEMFENKGDDWKKKEFAEVITTLTDYHANGSYEILKENVELKETQDFAWMVRSTDFEKNFENDFRYTDEKGYNFLRKSKVFGGEIIMSKIGNAGNVYLMPKVNRPCSLAMNLFLIRLDEKKAIPEYVFQYLKSKKGEIQIKSRLLGMATKTITKDNVRNIIIPFPPLETQKEIVAKLNQLQEKTKALETIYQQKLADLEELKKSILKKAFNGELSNQTTIN